MKKKTNLVEGYLEKTLEERQHYLATLSREGRQVLFADLAASAGADDLVSLEDFLELEMLHRVQMTPRLLQPEPVFTLEVFKDGVQLEVARSGGGRYGKDRKYKNFPKGTYTLPFRTALVLLESYGEGVEFLSQRGKVRERHKAREERQAKQQGQDKDPSSTGKQQRS